MDITLALGGGGAKGNAHIGVLRQLEKKDFHVKAIAGTSYGGLVAAFYALGYSPDEIEELFASIDQTQFLVTRRMMVPWLASQVSPACSREDWRPHSPSQAALCADCGGPEERE
jgi:predicted acylesterase/phospholipase RssA